MTNSPLNSQSVEDIWKDCLVDPDNAEPNIETVKIEGVVHSFIYDKAKLAKHQQKIDEMLLDLPSGFQASVGGGWSFLQACQNKDGEQWTGMHLVMEMLFTLGEAIGHVKCLMPRDMWSVLPGGMPYYAVDTSNKNGLEIL